MTRGEARKRIHEIVERHLRRNSAGVEDNAAITSVVFQEIAFALLKEERLLLGRALAQREVKLDALEEIISGCERCSIEADLKEA